MPTQHIHSPTDLAGLPQVGDILDGKYRLDGVLGWGGMGVVYAATHLRLAQRAAIKMLLPEWMDEPSVVERFAREGRASAAIRSEHIVRVLDVDECDGRPYLVLEYLEGKDFDRILAEEGALPVARAIDLMLQACEGVADAHAIGTIHRDLKPSNLFLATGTDGSPCVRILDFGISKVASRSSRTSTFQVGETQPLTVMGSPQYMSPEQMQSARDVDERSDIWSLGAILHELLAGSPPFVGETITEVCARVMTDPPPSLVRLRGDVPPALEGVVRRCLEKDRRRRYPSVAELARALSGFGTDAAYASAEKVSRVLEGGIVAHKPSISTHPVLIASQVLSDPSLPRGIRRPIGGYLLAVATVLALLGAAGWKIAMQDVAIRAAARELPQAELAPTALPMAAAPLVPIPSAVPAPAPMTSTTSARVVAPVATAAPAPVATAATPVHVAPHPPVPAVHRHVRRAPRPPSTPSWANRVEAAPAETTAAEPSPSLVEQTPAIAPLVAPPNPAPSASAPTDPDELFDQRK
jgi:serine/threonine protein kinase